MSLASPFCFATAILCVVSTGCGNSKRVTLSEVRGLLTLDGQPLAGAAIVFNPESSGTKGSRAVTDASGRYEMTYLRDIKGAVLGTHRVRITTATEHAPKEKLQDCYHRKSELTADVKTGDNTIDYKLTNK